jgi:hypothetical protein
MTEKKHFVYFINARSKSGSIEKYPIYKSGDDYFIGDHKVPKGIDIEDEIKKLYEVDVIGPEMPHPLHEETKFKNP